VAGTSLDLFSDGVVVADLNADGLPDVVTRNRQAHPTVYMNTGNGGFTERTETLGTQYPSTISLGMALADFNQDGHPDLLAVGSVDPDPPFVGRVNKARIGLNDGSGHFTTTLPLPITAAVWLPGDFRWRRRSRSLAY
jgi:hypothetical protein